MTTTDRHAGTTPGEKKIVFDWAGVLFRWHPETMLKREIPHIASDDAAAARWRHEIFQAYGGDWGEFDRGTVQAAELVQRIARRTGLPAADIQRVVDRVPHELQPIADTVRWLGELREQGRTLFFLSNMPEPYAAHLEREHAFIGWFAAGVISARVRHIKPEAGIFALAAERFGVADPGELVFLDDHLPNVESARSLGWNALQFFDAAQARADLASHGWA
ncbi:MAG: HAD family phosphatase [Rubrivivax sp.]|nr:HAD family phosphatase [Rubrivivax sp.]